MESFSVKLTHTLEKDHKYKCEMYVRPRATIDCYVDRIGFYFSEDSLKFIYPNFFEPEVESIRGHFLADTSTWELITGDFIADGTEHFLTIICFKQEVLLTLLNLT